MACLTESVKLIGESKQFGGINRRFKHNSTSLKCEMVFTVFFPPVNAVDVKAPVLMYLSGLSCTDENFIGKAGAQRVAAKLGVALVAPDTSPRGLNVPGESDSWDFGVGAGFYLNATREPWLAWRMYEYVTSELPQVLASNFPELDSTRVSLMGHSMGGHGALTIALKNPQQYKSVSALAPVCNPSTTPWGMKAFGGYLGDDRESWKQYDAVELVGAYQGEEFPLLVDTGGADPFLDRELKPERLEAALKAAGWKNATLRLQGGYDHGYAFVSTFIDDHIEFHAKHLKA